MRRITLAVVVAALALMAAGTATANAATYKKLSNDAACGNVVISGGVISGGCAFDLEGEIEFHTYNYIVRAWIKYETCGIRMEGAVNGSGYGVIGNGTYIYDVQPTSNRCTPTQGTYPLNFEWDVLPLAFTPSPDGTSPERYKLRTDLDYKIWGNTFTGGGVMLRPTATPGSSTWSVSLGIAPTVATQAVSMNLTGDKEFYAES